VVTLSAASPVDADVIRYLNRLSDYLFAAARQENAAAGGDEAEWRK
jgi:cob(I)alamin adenosyltransferase